MKLVQLYPPSEDSNDFKLEEDMLSKMFYLESTDLIINKDSLDYIKKLGGKNETNNNR